MTARLTAEEIAEITSDWTEQTCSEEVWAMNYAQRLLDHVTHTLAEEGRKDAEIAEALALAEGPSTLREMAQWCALGALAEVRAVAAEAEASRLSAEVERLSDRLRDAFMAGASVVDQQLIHFHEITVPGLLDGIEEAFCDYEANLRSAINLPQPKDTPHD